MYKRISVSLIALTLAFSAAWSQSTSVSFDSGSQMVFDVDTMANVPLDGGTTLDGDGFVLQLGYFSMATTGNNFSGTFIPLSGEGSANTAPVSGSVPTITYNQTSIGDLNANGAGDGTFAMTLTFTDGDPLSENNLPAGGTPLAIRFYNGATIGTATHYNTVSADSWLWAEPNTPPAAVTLSLDAMNLEWESISVFMQPLDTAFNTTILIPEPSTYALMGVALAGLGLARFRSRRKA